MRFDQQEAHPMALTVQFQLNPCSEPSLIPTTKQNKMLQQRRGKHGKRKAPEIKDQIRSEHRRWTHRRGVGRLNPTRETKSSGANGDEKWNRKLKLLKITLKRKIVDKKRRLRGTLRYREARTQMSINLN